jgi:hypothetical protein
MINYWLVKFVTESLRAAGEEEEEKLGDNSVQHHFDALLDLPRQTSAPKRYQFVIFALCYFLPNVVVMICARIEPRLKVGSRARAYLWDALMRKYYHLEKLTDVPTGDMVTLLQKDVTTVVSDGYLQFFNLFECFIYIIFNVIFQNAVYGFLAMPAIGIFIGVFFLHLPSAQVLDRSAERGGSATFQGPHDVFSGSHMEWHARP